MTSKCLLAPLLLSFLLAHYAVNAAVVSLYIPAQTPIAVSADVLGVDSSGHTTWRLSPGQPSGTLSVIDFPVATLVEGPNDAHGSQQKDNGDVVSEDCTIKDGLSVCTAVISASGSAATFTLPAETVSDNTFEVQVTGIPKNGAGRVASSSLGIAGVLMGVVYGLTMV